MDREQAQTLWLRTLACGPLDAAEADQLRAAWGAAGLDERRVQPLRDALRIADDLDRRREVIRQTRLLIRREGHDPDLLTTPAARMRGL